MDGAVPVPEYIHRVWIVAADMYRDMSTGVYVNTATIGITMLIVVSFLAAFTVLTSYGEGKVKVDGTVT